MKVEIKDHFLFWASYFVTMAYLAGEITEQQYKISFNNLNNEQGK